MANIKILIPIILNHEGGLVNDPNDAGGATNKGITLATYQQFFGKQKTVNDLKKITDAEWGIIFKKGYWDKWKADEIQNQSIANFLVDWTYNSGKYGITRAQKILGVSPDGIVGSKTLQALNNHPNKAMLFDQLQKDRIAYIDQIIKKRPQNAKFRKGWTSRINSFKYTER